MDYHFQPDYSLPVTDNSPRRPLAYAQRKMSRWKDWLARKVSKARRDSYAYENLRMRLAAHQNKLECEPGDERFNLTYYEAALLLRKLK